MKIKKTFSGTLGTHVLFIKTICSPSKSRETIPLDNDLRSLKIILLKAAFCKPLKIQFSMWQRSGFRGSKVKKLGSHAFFQRYGYRTLDPVYIFQQTLLQIFHPTLLQIFHPTLLHICTVNKNLRFKSIGCKSKIFLKYFDILCK